MMMAGKPIKVLVVDTQVYSNTGGQACTSGFTGSGVRHGAVREGARTARANPQGNEPDRHGASDAFVLQSIIAHVNHLLEGFIDGLNSRRPALFNIYAVCLPEHGVGDDRSVAQSKLAVESRAYPLVPLQP